MAKGVALGTAMTTPEAPLLGAVAVTGSIFVKLMVPLLIVKLSDVIWTPTSADTLVVVLVQLNTPSEFIFSVKAMSAVTPVAVPV
jgi:hypothetical protein